MKRKVIAAFLAATMVLGLAACGSSGGDSGDGGSSGGSSSKSDGKTIRLVNGKIEIDGTLKKLAGPEGRDRRYGRSRIYGRRR